MIIKKLFGGRNESSDLSFARYRGIFLGGGFAGLSKLITLVTVAISVPLTVGYLGPERYGMWMAISSLIALLTFADMGIGNGMVTALAGSDGRREQAEMARIVSSGFFMLLAIAGVILTVFLAIYSSIFWPDAFAVTGDEAAAEAGPSVLAFVICFAVSLPLTVVQRMQTGLQESWRSHLWQSAGALLSLVCVLLVIRAKAGVPWLILSMNGGPVLTNALNSVFEFWIRRPGLRPRLSQCAPTILRGLLASGALFVALQLFAMLGTTSDNFIIAHLFGAAAVGPYAVTYKLFQTSLIFGLFMLPLWPALGEALARGDRLWARRALNRAVAYSVGAGVALALGFALFGRDIVRLWAGSSVVPEQSMVAAFALWILLAAYGGAITALLNNAQFLRLQLKIYGFASLTALALKIPLASWLGPSGVVWATVVAYSLGYCLPGGIAVHRLFRVVPQAPV